MLGLLILKRLRLNVLSLKFFYGLLLFIGSAVLSGVVMTETLIGRMRYAQAREMEWRNALETARTYDLTFGQVILTPPLLSIVAEGVGDRLGMIARVFGHFGGVRIGGQAQSNRLLVLRSIDLMHVAGLLLSLMAILFTYDAISGERESGTLRLVLSNGFARRMMLMSEYLAALATLALAFIPAFLAWLLVVRMAGKLTFTSDEWKQLLLFLIATGLLTSIYVTAGLLVSSMARESTTSLMLGLALWVLTASLYPSLAVGSAARLRPIPPSHAVDERLLWNHAVAQAHLTQTLQGVSPIFTFYAFVSRIIGTDLEAYLQFVQYADRYQEQVAAWHRQKLSQHSGRESRWTSDPGSLEIDDFPQPAFTLPPLSQRIASSVSFFSILIALQGALSLLGLLAIQRYDVR
ncbi:hypothetical protein HRbin10_00997 [bacterium HR10]|nr:hypothetical protein HRbin10_00997 [bacterium HR10]